MSRTTHLASVRVGVEALRANRLRTFLSTLGVIIGVASLVAVLSLGDGMERFARDEMARTTSIQNVFVSPVLHDTVDGIVVPRERFRLFDVADARDAEARISGVAGAAISFSGTTRVTPPDGGRDRAARVTAATEAAASMVGLKIPHGRFFTREEVERNVPVAVVSHNLAAALAGAGKPESVLGKPVRMRGGDFTVVGVLEADSSAKGLAAFVPLGAGAAVMGPGEAGRPRMLVLQAATVEQVAGVAKGTETWLAWRYGSAKDFTVGTYKARAEQMAQGILLFKAFMGAITAISLLVGGIGIMNVLLASVTERTREIGIRKAVGARRRDIVVQFLAESVAVTGVGSLAGAVLGVAAAFGITAAMRAGLEMPIHAGLSLSTLVVAAVSAVVVGLSFGTYPAMRAARMSPIDAIRHE